MKNAMIALLLVTFAPATFAALDQYRTVTQVSAGGNGLPLRFASDGGLNATTSYVEIDEPDVNGAKAFAALAETGFVPTLRVRSVAGNLRHQAVAWAVQGYTNTSGTVLSTALVMQLSATLTGSNSNDLDARLYLFQDEDFEFYGDNGTMLFESSAQLWPGFAPFANNLGPTGFDIDINNFTGVVDESREFAFSVDPGDSFYVWARLVATADSPGMVDAFSTLTASFTNTTGLTPAAAAVPLPGAAALLAPAVALLGVANIRRGRRQAPGAASAE